MSTWDPVDHYFSGQGVVMIAERNALGNPKGFYPVGNVSDLKLTVAVTTLEHKESHTGQRGTDLRLTTETKVGLSMTMENFITENLKQVLRGTSARKAGGSVVAENIEIYPGLVTALDNIRASSIVVTFDTRTLVEYTDDETPWDYLVNEEAGSIKFNDGVTLATDELGHIPTAVVVGATTTVTVANAFSVGDEVRLSGFTGADAANLNGLTVTLTAASGTSISFAVDTTGDTITVTAGSTKVLGPAMAATVAYTYQTQYQLESLTAGVKEVFLRFEGLNTAEENNPVIVEVFKISTDPLKELSMISDTVQQFVLEGSVLADNTKVTGSKYFKIKQLT